MTSAEIDKALREISSRAAAVGEQEQHLHAMEVQQRCGSTPTTSTTLVR